MSVQNALHSLWPQTIEGCAYLLEKRSTDGELRPYCSTGAVDRFTLKLETLFQMAECSELKLS